MEMKVLLGVAVLALLALSVVQTFQLRSLEQRMTGLAVGGQASGQLDMSGWSADEKMMYEHHGTLPARLGGGGASGMAGGC
ncbi:hypothetical protein J4439_04465 [Candidatus Woesearchaeota archaeon]|nr:hypothetical protein [Candidatus Woesearchaeota archaeon]